jgi:hypothetical protein
MITHPDYDNHKDFEKLSTLSGFTDSSYKNDSCPSLMKWIDEKENHYIQLFVDYKDPSKRECSEQSPYFIVVNRNDEQYFYEAYTHNQIKTLIK